MKVEQRSFQGKLRIVAAATLATIVLAGPAYAATPTDAWITTKAKVALLTTEGVSSNAVNVDTVNRKITLHGIVATSDEKQKAEEAVRSIDGVTNVRNLLQVASSPAKEKAIEKSDEQIARDVRTALASKKSLDASTVTVQSVNKGVVLLAGKTDSLSDKLSAIQTARNVPGVRRVSSEIESADTLEGSHTYETSATGTGSRESTTGKVGDTAKSTGRAVENAAKDTGNAVADATRSATGATSDAYTTSMVKVRLLANKETPALDINVDTNDGVVTLFGIVPSAAAKAQATAEARKVSSVKNVRNELQVVASAKQPEVKTSDQEVASDVKQKLRENDALKDVSADVKNCVVRLTGKVPSRDERIEAMQVARATRGVCAVQDDLRFQ